MKQRIILAVTLLLSVALLSVAADKEKKFRKLVERYDLTDSARLCPAGSPAEFWNLAMSTDAELTDFDKDISRKGGAQKEAREEIASTPRLYPEYSEAIDRGVQAWCDSLIATTDSAYAVCVTSALFNHPGLDDDMLKALVVGEFVHGLWRHPLQRFFDDARKKRSDRLWGSVAVAGLFAADVALAAEANRRGIRPLPYDDIDVTVNIEQKAPTPPGFLFEKDQVYQADLIAYRFMEWAGKPEAYVRGLKLLGSGYDSMYQAAGIEDYPTLTSRINFINYVASNPEMGNKRDRERRVKAMLSAQEKEQIKQIRRRR
ncbi:MAG: hypothetical protein NC336_00820 [Clostridium sp.]|nr:hypothetical protein [Clostridium sp.]